MPRKTIVGLEAEIVHLRWSVSSLQGDLDKVKAKNNILAQQLDLLQRYINTMIVGGEKLADALSHAIGFVTDRSRIVEGRSTPKG